MKTVYEAKTLYEIACAIKETTPELVIFENCDVYNLFRDWLKLPLDEPSEFYQKQMKDYRKRFPESMRKSYRKEIHKMYKQLLKQS